MSLSKEILENLSKEDLINLITQNYKTFEDSVFAVKTKLIYDEKTDKIIDFKIEGDLPIYNFQKLTTSEFEIKQYIFLMALRNSGITNMMASEKYLRNIGGTKSILMKYITEYNTLFQIMEKCEEDNKLKETRNNLKKDLKNHKEDNNIHLKQEENLILF